MNHHAIALRLTAICRMISREGVGIYMRGRGTRPDYLPHCAEKTAGKRKLVSGSQAIVHFVRDQLGAPRHMNHHEIARLRRRGRLLLSMEGMRP